MKFPTSFFFNLLISRLSKFLSNKNKDPDHLNSQEYIYSSILAYGKGKKRSIVILNLIRRFEREFKKLLISGATWPVRT
jgi:hypothetical protein